MILSIFYTSRFLFYNTIFFNYKDKQAENLRIYLESMGPVFIKFGQLLSTHKYWLNNYQYKELSRLIDNINLNYDLSHIKQKIPDNLKISKNSISNGSIATVHLGKYNNKTVVIKVKRKNIENEMYYTLLFFRPFLYITKYIPYINKWNFFAKFKKIDDIMNQQCNFNREISNMETFYKLYGNIVKIPKVESFVPHSLRTLSTDFA